MRRQVACSLLFFQTNLMGYAVFLGASGDLPRLQPHRNGDSPVSGCIGRFALSSFFSIGGLFGLAFGFELFQAADHPIG